MAKQRNKSTRLLTWFLGAWIGGLPLKQYRLASRYVSAIPDKKNYNITFFAYLNTTKSWFRHMCVHACLYSCDLSIVIKIITQIVRDLSCNGEIVLVEYIL